MAGNKNVFNNIEKKSGVNMSEIMKLADSLKNADFSDEKTVRKIVRRVGKIANRNVSKEQEDKLVKAITSGKVPKDINSLAKMMKK
ncbi:stage VI sporulation protein F [Bacillus marinisedimentorum]|uniref:stage VI sporulation protein F n=1 Tax=Bacillus marinisedimentorum TaxID=1821260 RepID=UPI0008731EC0|nr:stage VI sporulation protein F [Bacillus marinisedimentorum]